MVHCGRGGFRENSGRPRKFANEKTKVVRVPASVDVEALVYLLDDLRALVGSWEAEVSEPLHATSPRYERFKKAMEEVARLLPE